MYLIVAGAMNGFVTLENIDQLVKTGSKVEKMGILQEKGCTNNRCGEFYGGKTE